MMNDEVPDSKQNKNKILNILNSKWLFLILLIAILLFRIFHFTVHVDGLSMYPTFEDGQKLSGKLLINKNNIPTNQIVVFWNPKSCSLYIKRVIGVPGDNICIKNGYVYVNNKRFSEAGNFEKIKDAGLANNEITLDKNEYFVLGDNRNNSIDSRILGSIQKKQIIAIIDNNDN